MITYGHDQHITEAISAACDARVIWKGQETGELAVDFHSQVRTITAAKRHEVDVSTAIAKRTQATRAMIDDDVTGYRRYDKALTVELVRRAVGTTLSHR